jgi:vitamin B12 transporter
MDNKFGLRVVGYKRNMTDAIIYGQNGFINKDQQNDKGFEIEPSFKMDKITLGAFYAYVEGLQRSGTITSNILLRRPNHTMGLNAGYQLSNQLFVNLNYKYSGDRVDRDFRTFPAVNEQLAGFNLIDLYAEYSILNKKVRFFMDLKNLTNQKYTEIIGYSTMGTNFNTGLSFNFK